MRYACEARQTGKKSFHFDTIDGEVAKAVCDANGWELIRVYEKDGDSDRPAKQSGKGDPPLSRKQISTLIIESGKAWQQQKGLGLTDQDQTDWRHEQVWTVVKRKGLSHCQNSHYRKLLSHFRTLRGVKDPGGKPTGKWSKEGGDSVERREQLMILLAKELGEHARRVQDPRTNYEMGLALAAQAKGGPVNEAYLLHLAKAKNPGQTLHDIGCLLKLPASRLEHLLFTLRNRIAAREGRGDSGNRDKKQKGDS